MAEETSKNQDRPRTLTPEEFLQDWPLYTEWEIKDFWPPASLSLNCPTCKKETTWGVTKRIDLYDLVAISGVVVRYDCNLCKKRWQLYVTRRTDTSVSKAGQSPPQSIHVSNELKSQLSESATLYERSLICRNAGYGIGALAYMRRVIEDKTNELLQVVIDQALSLGAPKNEVDKLRELVASKEYIPFEDKLHLASEAIPGSLLPDGANPLAALFGLVSGGLHDKTEEQCIAIFDNTRDVFEYVFTRLKSEIKEKNRIAQKVKNLLSLK